MTDHSDIDAAIGVGRALLISLAFWVVVFGLVTR